MNRRRTASLFAVGGLLAIVTAKNVVPVPAGVSHGGLLKELPVASLPTVLYADSVMRTAGATAIVPQVTGSWDRDPATNAYRYTYVLKNDPSSGNTITEFALAPMPPPMRTEVPAHWGNFYGYEERSDALLFSVVDAGAAPAGWDSVSDAPSPYDLQPGDSVTFVVVSTLSPTMITFYAQGFNIEPTDGESESPDPPSLFNNSVTGTVIGPGSTVGVGEHPSSSGKIELRPPIPNPARASVTIVYSVAKPSRVSLSVYDVLGRKVATLVDGLNAPGIHSTTWNGTTDDGHQANSGMYFYRLFVDGQPVGNRRVTILR